MMRSLVQKGSVLAMVSVLALAGCNKKTETTTSGTSTETTAASGGATAPAPGTDAVHVTDVQLGKALGPDKKVQASVDTFAPNDTIFASVSTSGNAPSATVTAKWTFQDGQVVKSDSRSISPNGPAFTEFSIQKPGGWPKGNYQLEVGLDGQTTKTTRSFKVQ